MKKRVLIIGTAYPLRGGLAAYNERLAYAFQEGGHEVQIYTFTLQYPSFLFPGKSQHATDGIAPEGLKIKTAINSVNPLNWIKIGSEIKKLKPDIIIIKFWLPFMGPCFGTILKIARRNNHTKIIAILDNVIPHEKRLGDGAFTQYFVNQCDGFIAMSASVLKDLKLFTQTRQCRLVAHPLYDNFGDRVSREEARNKLGLPLHDKLILFFGFIRHYKGLDLLLETMSADEIKKRNIKLIVAGEFYEDRRHYDAIVEKHHIKDSVFLHTDFIPDNIVKYYFSSADLIVQPYRSATQSGITQMAYHFEIPIITTNVGGLPEMVPHGKVGLVCEPEVSSIAKSIVEFFDNNLGQEFSENIKEEKKKYSWENLVRAILEMSEE